jgi:hypothetical protein
MSLFSTPSRNSKGDILAALLRPSLSRNFTENTVFDQCPDRAPLQAGNGPAFDEGAALPSRDLARLPRLPAISQPDPLQQGDSLPIRSGRHVVIIIVCPERAPTRHAKPLAHPGAHRGCLVERVPSRSGSMSASSWS